MEKQKVIFFWSGGKDSALALHKLANSQTYTVKSLITTLNCNHRRISMHGIREELLDEQARSLNLPLEKMWVEGGSNEEYENVLKQHLFGFKKEGITHVVFGDIFLQDLKDYRDKLLSSVGMKGIYPLWQQSTKELIREFLSLKFKTITCCVTDAQLSKEHVGKVIDHDFINELPSGVDPCGENGEFHTFAFDGPIFKKEVSLQTGEKLYRPLDIQFTKDQKPDGKPVTRGFWFCDLLTG